MYSNRSWLHRAASTLMFLFAVATANTAFAQEKLNVDDHGVFLNGYDVVGYFADNEAVRGSPQHTLQHGGATLHFSSKANKEAFAANPAKFMPKYGGFCAFAVAHDQGGVKANPKTFKLYNGELLMFFDDQYEGKRFNTSVPWNADERAFYVKAEANWPHLRN